MPGGSCQDPWFTLGPFPLRLGAKRLCSLQNAELASLLGRAGARASGPGSVPAKVVPSHTAPRLSCVASGGCLATHRVCELSCGLRVHHGGSGRQRPTRLLVQGQPDRASACQCPLEDVFTPRMGSLGTRTQRGLFRELTPPQWGRIVCV